MKVGIICAGDEELAPFLPLIKDRRTVERAMLKFHTGRLEGVEVVALFSGVCKVNAAIAAQLLIDLFGAELIVNAGTAGGMSPDLDIFDTVISTQACYHDVSPNNLIEFHPWMSTAFFPADSALVDLSRSAVARLRPAGKVVWGRMATGEAFITDEGRQRILDDFSPLTTDMETAAVAHVCYVNGIPFIAVRCITDTAAHSGVEAFDENCDKAAAIAKDITVALLRELRDSAEGK